MKPPVIATAIGLAALLLVGCADIALRALIDRLAEEDPVYAWFHEREVTAPSPVAGDNFGSALALSESFAAIGAYGENSDTGAVYVFVRESGDWSYRYSISAAGGVAGDGFGYAVALWENRLAVGAPGCDGGAGAVYLYELGAWSCSSPVPGERLTPIGPFGPNLGKSVAISGDYAAAGTEKETLECGAAYVFYRNQPTAGNWGQQQKLNPGTLAANDWFAYSLALDGDYLLVGTPKDSETKNLSGAAYLFRRSGSAWSQVGGKIKAATPVTAATLGWSVSLDGTRILLGTPGENKVYELANLGSAWAEAGTIVSGEVATGDGFGQAVALNGDVVLVGAPYHDKPFGNAGAAFLFEWMDAAWGSGDNCAPSGLLAGDNFGISTAVFGDAALVGVRKADAAGAAHFYERLQTNKEE